MEMYYAISENKLPRMYVLLSIPVQVKLNTN